MKRFAALVLGLVLVAGLAAGCGKDSPSSPQDSAVTPAAEDVSMVNDAVAGNSDYVDEDEYESNEIAQLDPASPGLSAGRSLFWWRTIRSVTRRFETRFDDPDSTGRPTTAVVTVHKRFLGAFNVLMGDSVSRPDSLVRKPLDDRWVRHLLFKRVRVTDTGRSLWKLAGTSGVEVTSENAVTRIQSVRVQAGVLDTTITDPLEMHRLRRVLLIPAGTQVAVTVTTRAADDVVVLYRWRHRFRFTNNGDGTHTFRWTTTNEAGLRHFGVNALSNGTLFDAASPYDSNAWLFPFVVNAANSRLEG